jgi:UDP-GlcNAc:undecaprenyl-phosphate GlcNAc-1-phosphate transferase
LADEARLAGALLVALAVTLAVTPIARSYAIRIGFFDRPHSYKRHAAPVPYLGGLALLAGIIAAALAFGGGTGEYWPILACAAVLWVAGTADDRTNLSPVQRVALEIAAATILWTADLGWSLFSSDVINLVVTNLWVVGVVNALNLMDNIDGAAGTVGAVTGLGIGAFAAAHGDPVLAGMAFAVAGACLGFLPYNFSTRSKIFLGDGGSMPLGFVAAAVVMSVPMPDGIGAWSVLVLGGLLVGLPLFDTALVIFSRRRRGARISLGGSDHLTHRLVQPLGSARRVAGVLALTQASLCGLAIALAELPRTACVAATIGCVTAGLVVVIIVDMPQWLPVRRKSVGEPAGR